jgi:hypothetical protein
MAAAWCFFAVVVRSFGVPATAAAATTRCGATTRRVFTFPTLPKSCAERLIHSPEAFDAACGGFRVECARLPQLAGSSVISAVAARVDGRPQELRLISDSATRSSVVCLGGDHGTPRIIFDFTVIAGEDEHGCVLQVDTHHFRASPRWLARTNRLLSERIIVQASCRLSRCSEGGGALARHRALLYRHLIVPAAGEECDGSSAAR